MILLSLSLHFISSYSAAQLETMAILVPLTHFIDYSPLKILPLISRHSQAPLWLHTVLSEAFLSCFTLQEHLSLVIHI